MIARLPVNDLRAQHEDARSTILSIESLIILYRRFRIDLPEHICALKGGRMETDVGVGRTEDSGYMFVGQNRQKSDQFAPCEPKQTPKR